MDWETHIKKIQDAYLKDVLEGKELESVSIMVRLYTKQVENLTGLEKEEIIEKGEQC